MFVIGIITHQIPFAANRIMMNVVELLHEELLIVHRFCIEIAPARTEMIYGLGNFYIILLAHNSCKFELLPILTVTLPKTLCYEQHSKLVDEG